MINLRDYQWDAVHFLMSHPRSILGDEVGLGKTYPAIHAAVEAWDGTLPILVVCPPYLIGQWCDAIRAYLGDQDVLPLRRADPPVPKGYDGWVVVGYHTLTHAGLAKHPELLATWWDSVILDEAHRMRGRNSQWTRAAQKLKADHAWLLTGTPVVNNPGDLFPLLKLLDPKRFTSYWRFVNEWCETEVTPWATRVLGVKRHSEERFHAMLDDYMIRRRIEDHLPELPPQIDHFVPVELPKATQKAHDEAKKLWRIEHPDLDVPIAITSGGALVVKLRQLTAGTLPLVEGGKPPKTNPKLEAVKGVLDDHPDEPAIVFCWFRDTAKLVYEGLHDPGRGSYLLTGDQAPAVRAAVIDCWEGDSNGVIVATMACMQEGLNLQHAHLAVFAEHDYLPGTHVQAVARLRRFGQGYPVNVFHVYARHSIDETVWRVAETRRHEVINRALLEDLFAERKELAA